MSCPRLRCAIERGYAGLGTGAARDALFSWLLARRRAGTFLLRSDITAAGTEAAERRVMDDLLWLGLGWDEGIDAEGEHGPYRRSQRLELYLGTAEDLVRRGLACRTGARTIRLRSTAPNGPGDPELIRQDGQPDHDFATAVDDRLMGITHVVSRSDETPALSRQALVHAAVGEGKGPVIIRLAPISVLVEASAGQAGVPPTIECLRDEGYPPEAVLNLLAHLGAATNGTQEVLTREEMLAGFDPDHATDECPPLDPQRLADLSVRHMARMSHERLAVLAAGHLQAAGLLGQAPSPDERAWAGAVARLYVDRLARMSDLPELASLLFRFDPGRSLTDDKVAGALREPGTRRVVEALLSSWSAAANAGGMTAVRFQSLVSEVRRTTGAKGEELYDAIRIALTGQSEGPDLARLIALIERGSRLPLPREVVGCAERATRLIEVAGRGAP